MDKKEEKEIEYLFAHVNRLWMGLMVIGGGIIGICLSMPFSMEIFSGINLFKAILAMFGFMIIWLMITGLINTDNRINKIIKGEMK